MKRFIVLLLAVLSTEIVVAQSFRLIPRLSYITTEDKAEVIVKNLTSQTPTKIKVSKDGKSVKSSLESINGVDIININSSELTTGSNQFDVAIGENEVYKLNISKLAPKSNEVKIDHLTGVTIADGRSIIPCGFYAYSPVQFGLLDEEVVRGMNLFSPYQFIESKTIKERIKYMDRCAQLGMKVNYNLLNIAGGGGIKFDKSSKVDKYKLLESEIMAIKDHPALLGWYIADEPDGQGVSAETLEDIYARIKAIDPYHPISIVILNAEPGRRYSSACDIIMCDSYPVPNSPANEVIAAIEGLQSELQYEKAVWYVPQTFGGNEWWEREPSSAEIRMMTWGSAVAGARGFQAFVRHGLNAFPKNQNMWETYTKACREITEIQPFFEYGAPSHARIYSNDSIKMVSYEKDNQEVIVLVNSEPSYAKFKIASNNTTGKAYSYFENYEEQMINGTIEGSLAPLEVKIFKIFRDKNDIRAFEGDPKIASVSNILPDPSFEWMYSVSSGVPAVTYGGAGSDRGATYAIDSRVVYHGDHSLRLTTPTEGAGCKLTLFKLPYVLGKSYILSIWAKADKNSLENNPGGMKFKLNIGTFTEAEYTLTSEWKRYEISGTYGEGVTDPRALVSTIELVGVGTAWFDLAEVVADMDITVERIADSKCFSVTMNNNIPGSEIYYTLDGTEPTPESLKYSSPLTISKVERIKARLFNGDKSYGLTECLVASHKAVGAKVTYITPYTKYTAGGDGGLTDGMIAEQRMQHSAWQGFVDNNMEVVIDLGASQKIDKITTSFLRSIRDWVVPPKSVEFLISEDGVNFTSLETRQLGDVEPVKDEPALRVDVIKDDISKTIRYVKIVATSRLTMPSWHSPDKSWLFTDEIIIE